MLHTKKQIIQKQHYLHEQSLNMDIIIISKLP